MQFSPSVTAPLSNAPDLDRLSQVPLFRGLTSKQLSALKCCLHYKICHAKTVIITAEQLGEAVYIILGGSVKVYVEEDGHEEVILAILGPGQTIGEMSLSDNLAHSATVVTREETTLLWMAARRSTNR